MPKLAVSIYTVFSLFLLLEPSLTIENVLHVLADINNPKMWGKDALPAGLQVPESKVTDMERLCPDLSQRQSALIRLWLGGHPAPSWELVCFALYTKGEYEMLENVKSKYLKGNV